MKKSAKFKKIGLTAVALPVCVATMCTCFTFATPASVAAAEGESSKKELFDAITVEDTCAYGENFYVPVAGSGVNVQVTAPSGGDPIDLGAATDGRYSVKANEVGNYIVKYSTESGDVSYDFNVHVSLEEEYFLRLDDNGADIPTYIQKNGTFKLPGAKVVYYDENNFLQSYPDVDLTITSTQDGGKEYAAGDTFTASKNGKIYITYSAKVGDDGLKFFNQTFTVNVQNTLNDTVAPTLTVSGVTSDVSVNRAVTLPKATASDNYDENIKLTVKVTAPDGSNVKRATVNKHGFAEKDEDGEEVVFDNDKAMTFYPTEEGRYTVSYIAEDDAGNKSSERVYYINASDLAAPVFEDVADHNIPETWGLSVKNSENKVINNGTVKFPVPTVIDNKDRMYAKEEGDENLISVYFRVYDSDNSKTVIEFNNILSESDRVVVGNDVYGFEDKNEDGSYKSFEFGEDGFVFDFNKYNKKDAKGDAADLPGTYTVLYRARDKAGNTSSKTYTIKLENEYTDNEAPVTPEINVPAYLSETEKTFDVPSPVVADAKDSRPQIDYRIYTDNGGEDVDGGKYITVKGGEKADIEKRGSDLYFVFDKDQTVDGESVERTLKLGTKLYFYVEVTDKVGNVTRNTKENVADHEQSSDVVEIIKKNENKEYNYTTNNMAIASTEANDTEINVGDEVKAAGFNITTTYAMSNYTGFEVAVSDKDGNAVNVTLDTFTARDKANNSAEIYVKNIVFRPSVVGEHSLVIRVFDVNGRNSVYGYTFDVKASENGGVDTQAATIGTTGSVNVKYKLHNEVMKNVGTAGNTYYVARQIKGGVFSLMGSEFTAKTQGSYSVKDGYINKNAISGYTNFGESVTPYGGNDGKYTFSISDSAVPVIEVQGVMPTFGDKNVAIVLPKVVAYTENGNAKVTVEVTKNKSNAVDFDEETNSFIGTTDGEYTVTYTATYANSAPVTATYTINIGDVEGPEFTISGGTSIRKVVGDTFKFDAMELVDTSEEGTVEITKKLIDPSRDEVSGATVSGSYRNYANSENNGTTITLDKVGTYEVVYTAKDAVGNTTTQRVTITVVGKGSSTPTTLTTLSTVLIVVAIVLLAGVIIYVVRFRKVKK